MSSPELEREVGDTKIPVLLVKIFFNILHSAYKVNEPHRGALSSDANKKAFVTGGSGFIGSHTVEELLTRGIHLRCAVRSHAGWLNGLPVELVRADLLDPSAIRRCIEDVDYVIHIAGVTKAKRREEYFRGNAETTRHLLEACTSNRTLQKFCFISSLTAVGPSADGTPLTEDAPCHPITAYGRSKYEAERLCLSYRDRIPITILRPPAVYGPRDRDIFEIFRGVKLGILPIFGREEKTLSLIHGKDLARAIVDSTLSERTTGEVYFVTDPEVYRYVDLIQMLSVIMNHRARMIRLPKTLLYLVAGIVEAVSFFLPSPAVLSRDKARDLLQPHWVCDGSKLRQHIGFTVRVPIEERLRATFEWYKSHGWL
jgi:nucleoside-diphosphate-sugar epimerase